MNASTGRKDNGTAATLSGFGLLAILAALFLYNYRPQIGAWVATWGRRGDVGHYQLLQTRFTVPYSAIGDNPDGEAQTLFRLDTITGQAWRLETTLVLGSTPPYRQRWVEVP